jgi:hypothetical protein
VRRAGGKPFPRTGDKAFLLAPAGADGPGFLMLGNFRSIMRYNPSEAYALAIGHFADRLRGGQPFVQEWPRQERVLSRDERFELSSCSPGAASIAASRTAPSAARRRRRCAAIRRRPGCLRTGLPRPACWRGCAGGKTLSFKGWNGFRPLTGRRHPLFMSGDFALLGPESATILQHCPRPP